MLLFNVTEPAKAAMIDPISPTGPDSNLILAHGGGGHGGGRTVAVTTVAVIGVAMGVIGAVTEAIGVVTAVTGAAVTVGMDTVVGAAVAGAGVELR